MPRCAVSARVPRPAELERRLGHVNDRYLRLYTNPPGDIAASYVEHL
jgi:hypothetical protein